jgi:hypothetical protein
MWDSTHATEVSQILFSDFSAQKNRAFCLIRDHVLLQQQVLCQIRLKRSVSA